MNIRQQQGIAPLPNGTFLVGMRRSGDHDRVLVVPPIASPDAD